MSQVLSTETMCFASRCQGQIFWHNHRSLSIGPSNPHAEPCYLAMLAAHQIHSC